MQISNEELSKQAQRAEPEILWGEWNGEAGRPWKCWGCGSLAVAKVSGL